VIKLERGDKPAILLSNEAPWTAEYCQRLDGDESVPVAALTRYRHKEIKAAVIRDANGKCIYCESKPLAVYPGAVEHILPKGRDRFPERALDWTNLGFVCHECNREKGDYWNEDAPILDPFVDEPQKHLLFFGPLVLGRDESVRGVVTVHELKLDRRDDLIERKSEHIRSVKQYIRSWKSTGDGPLKRVLAEQIREFAARDQEYTATTRALLDLEGFTL
jgi:hypothetical protein